MTNRKDLLIAAFIVVGTIATCVRPGSAQLALQTVNASQNSLALPSSTGQLTSLTECRRIIASNLALAPNYGYLVKGGSFEDAPSNIVITQDCDSSGLYTAPAHPFAGAAPIMQKVSAPTIDATTEIWLAIGQSNAGNYGHGRYVAQGQTFDYAGDGIFYPAGDPLHDPGDTGATDASPWPRLADLMKNHAGLNGRPIKQIIIAQRAVGGTCIAEWAPGGGANGNLLAWIKDMIAHRLTPTRIFFVQGECDAASGSSRAAWEASFLAMRNSIRTLDIVAPIYVATTTICNVREANTPPNDLDQVLNRTPDYYVNLEKSRLAIRAAQSAVVDGAGVRAGPNLDAIDWHLRSEADGCHFGMRGLDTEAQLWSSALN